MTHPNSPVVKNRHILNRVLQLAATHLTCFFITETGVQTNEEIVIARSQ